MKIIKNTINSRSGNLQRVSSFPWAVLKYITNGSRFASVQHAMNIVYRNRYGSDVWIVVGISVCGCSLNVVDKITLSQTYKYSLCDV